MSLSDTSGDKKEEARMEGLIKLVLRSENFSFKWRSRPKEAQELQKNELIDILSGNKTQRLQTEVKAPSHAAIYSNSGKLKVIAR